MRVDSNAFDFFERSFTLFKDHPYFSILFSFWGVNVIVAILTRKSLIDTILGETLGGIINAFLTKNKNKEDKK